MDFMKLLFEGVNSLEDLTRKLEPPAERELVRRASLLQYFDEQVFNRYLVLNLPESQSITFEKFVNNLNLEPVPRTNKVFRVKEEARRPCLDELRSEQKAGGDAKLNNEEVFRRLLEYYQGLGPEGEFDRLALLIVLNPQQAKEEFERLYAEADERFDLARCNDILRTFEARTQLLEEDLRLLCQSKRQYYNARSLYATDFYQTTTYLARGTMSKEFSQFLSLLPGDAGKWIFHVYATGGLGKTMFVRWLISRCSVPEPRRIPVARLDFDMLDLNSASLHPLLLLLPIAEQLDQQIAQRPFNETFKSMWVFRPLLDRPTGDERDARRFDLEQSFQSIEKRWRDTAIAEFCRTLKEANFTGPIVIAIDTLEEMLLLSKESLAKVMRQIEEIHEAYPALRLVLSGRYDLREGLKGLEGMESLFEAQAINYELKRFTPAEARTYMTEMRKLKDSDLIEAIVKKCAANEEQAINPFVLSLITDLVVSKVINTVEDVRKLPRPEVAYLINRIIDRINDGDIRWMLRYASVPRTFTLDTLENVLWPHLLAERVSGRGHDTRSKGAEGIDQMQYWQPGESSSAKEAWDKLKPLASTYGWVSFDTNDGKRMRLHPDVRVPMRILLSDEEIYPLLHKDAARYFERKAKAEPEQWADWMCEAIYHRFQLDGAKAAHFWREQLGRKRAETNMEVRVRVASEITKRDYVDEQGMPLKRREDSEETIVAVEDLCEAHHEAAVASIMLTARHAMNTVEYAEEWGNVRQHLLKLSAIMGAAVTPAFKPRFGVEAFAELATEWNKALPDRDVVLRLAEEALASTTSLFLQLSLTIQLVEMYAERDPVKAEDYFKQAQAASGLLQIPFLSTVTITLKLAKWYQDNGRFISAINSYKDALAHLKPEKEMDTARHINHLMAKANLEIGRYSTAESLSREAFSPQQSAPISDQDWDNALLFNNLQAKELLNPLIALRNADELLQAADNDRRRAGVLELRGYALGQLMQFEEALRALGMATELWEKVKDPTGTDRARMYRVELQLNQIGNLNEAAHLLDIWETQSEKKDAELACQMELLRVRCLYEMGREDAAREKWQSLSRKADLTLSARSSVRTLLTGLVLGFGGVETFEQLVKALEKINPSSARLSLLTSLHFAQEDGNRGKGTDDYSRLIKLVKWPPEKRETIYSALLYVDLLQLCDARDRAETMLAFTASKALKDENSFAFVRVLSALNHYGFQRPSEASLYSSTFLEDYKDYRNLCRAALLEEAARALKVGALDNQLRAFSEAMNFYSPSNTATKWDALTTELATPMAEQLGEQAKALSNLTIAASIYEQLGDQRSLERVTRQWPAAQSLGERLPLPQQDDLTHTVRFEIVDGSINSIHTTASGEYRYRPGPISDERLFMATLRDRSEIFELTSWMVDNFSDFTWRLREILIPPPVERSLERLVEKSRQFDLRLETPTAGLAKIPWELALVNATATSLPPFYRYIYRGAAYGAGHSDTTRWIQHAARLLLGLTSLKVDGILGPRTMQALKDAGFAGDEINNAKIYPAIIALLRTRLAQSEKALKALTVSPSFETQITAQRGGGGIESVSLRNLYDRSHFDTGVIEVDDNLALLEAFERAISDLNPQLIHIESSFKASPTTGQVYLDFNSGTRLQEGEWINEGEAFSSHVPLSATIFNDVLLKLRNSQPRMLVIIEAQSPPGESAAALQMLLRNSFASELFQLGNTCGVIATGLFRAAEDRQRTLMPLIDNLSKGLALGDAVNAANSEGNYRKGISLQDPPTAALFTNDPLITLLPA